jgi:hypothetical protein
MKSEYCYKINIMAPTQKLPLEKRPLNLAEVLRLRNGIELPQKVLPECTVEKIFERTKSYGLPIFSLN